MPHPLEQVPLSQLQYMADLRIEHLYKSGNADAYNRCIAYVEQFYNDIPSLIEFIQDFDQGVFNAYQS